MRKRVNEESWMGFQVGIAVSLILNGRSTVKVRIEVGGDRQNVEGEERDWRRKDGGERIGGHRICEESPGIEKQTEIWGDKRGSEHTQPDLFTIPFTIYPKPIPISIS